MYFSNVQYILNGILHILYQIQDFRYVHHLFVLCHAQANLPKLWSKTVFLNLKKIIGYYFFCLIKKKVQSMVNCTHLKFWFLFFHNFFQLDRCLAIESVTGPRHLFHDDLSKNSFRMHCFSKSLEYLLSKLSWELL